MPARSLDSISSAFRNVVVVRLINSRVKTQAQGNRIPSEANEGERLHNNFFPPPSGGCTQAQAQATVHRHQEEYSELI